MFIFLKKSNGVISGERGGHTFRLVTHFAENISEVFHRHEPTPRKVVELLM